MLSRPKKRKRNGGKPFYWSAGPMPSTGRGQRRHAARSSERAEHAKMVWNGGYELK